MGSFIIEGGHRLKGDLHPQGAKNEALQVLSAVLLTSEKVRMENVPGILDVNKLIEILGDMGVKVQKIDANTYEFQADEINPDFINSKTFIEKAAKLRGSVMFFGAAVGPFRQRVHP